jgi:polar amino acid transport system permease protein
VGFVETFFNWGVLTNALPLLLSGLKVTLSLGAVSILAGLVLGLFIALLRLYAPLPVSLMARVYIDIFRSIPILVLLIVVYYALPFVGLRLSPFLSAATALTLVSGAYTAEILPQAIRVVIPPLTGNCINVMKDTALASVVAMPDLLKQATQAQALEANPTPLIAAAAMYIAILWPLVILVGRLEKRYRRVVSR